MGVLFFFNNKPVGRADAFFPFQTFHLLYLIRPREGGRMIHLLEAVQVQRVLANMGSRDQRFCFPEPGP